LALPCRKCSSILACIFNQVHLFKGFFMKTF